MGATGAAGSNGIDGAVGATGAAGTTGAVGATGAAGTNGIDGAVGATGAAGTPGINAVVAFADYYALMPSDNTATVAGGAAVAFPQDGPSNGVIIRTSSTQFTLPAVGTYMVSWQVSVDEAGQLVLEINGTENAATVVGRATGTTQIVGNRLITTTSANSILRVVSPTGNTPALTITPLAGGSHAVSASLVITRIQ
jgi:hypothetical protein